MNNDLFNSETSLSVYPNPTKDILYIKPLDNQKFDVSIYSITGQLVSQYSNLDNNQIDIKNLEKGIYILKITSQNNIIHIQKIIKD